MKFASASAEGLLFFCTVTLGTSAVSIIVFADEKESIMTSLIVFQVAIVFCSYALLAYKSRRDKIADRDPGPYDDGIMPVILSFLLIVVFTLNFALHLSQYVSAP